MKQIDLNKSATDGFSIQNAIKKSIIKGGVTGNSTNMNSMGSNNVSQHKTERSINTSVNRGGGVTAI